MVLSQSPTIEHRCYHIFMTIPENLIFAGVFSFFHIFQNFKIPYFHDWKTCRHFSGVFRCCGNPEHWFLLCEKSCVLFSYGEWRNTLPFQTKWPIPGPNVDPHNESNAELFAASEFWKIGRKEHTTPRFLSCGMIYQTWGQNSSLLLILGRTEASPTLNVTVYCGTTSLLRI